MKTIVMGCAAAILAASFLFTQSWAQEKEKPSMPGMPMPKPTPVPQDPATLPNLSEKSKWPEPVTDDMPYSYALFDLLEYQRVEGANALRWDFSSIRLKIT